MSSSNIAPAKKMTFSVAITTENYRNMINNTLKEPGRANRFIAAITSAVATTPALQTCDPSSILAGGLLGEALNLSPSPQLGQYYLVPFKQKAKYDREGHLLSPECSKAQFVLGYKGYVQLALRSGQYSDLDCMEIRQGEYLGKDPQTGKPQFKFIEDDDLREKLPIVGYMAYFEYLNGFRKCIYWSRERCSITRIHILRRSARMPMTRSRTDRLPTRTCGSIRASGTKALMTWLRKRCFAS